jgi:dephospho-CoA kinase
LIGLTGGIGSGKSTVATLFEALGARIIDTDELSRQLTRSGGIAIAAIRDTFGPDYIDSDGALDRHKMRERVFSDAGAKARLEAILHPAIYDRAQYLAAAATQAPYTLLVVPLLLESQNYQGWVQRTLVVDCPEESQISRTMQRSGLDRNAVLAIMAQQIDRSRRLALADDIIRNDSDLAALENQVFRQHNKYLTLATGSD